MIWMLVVVMMGAIAYTISIVSEYTAFVREIQPRMQRAHKERENLSKLIEVEARALGQLEEALSADQDAIEEMRREIIASQDELKRESRREHDLEMTAYKQEFRASKKRL